MEVSRDVKPAACLLEAFNFVIVHRWPCLLRAVPIVMLTALLAWLETNILERTDIFRVVINDLLYAIFAVFWHRYTLLARERDQSDYGLAFGLREMKFAGAMLAYAGVSYLVARIFIAGGGGSIMSVVVFISLLLLSFLPLMFVFPAIALDHPLALSLFARRVVEMSLPLVGTFLLGIVGIAGLYVLVYLPVLLLAALNRPGVAGVLFYLFSSFLIMPFILAVFISFVSILYREAMGTATSSVHP